MLSAHDLVIFDEIFESVSDRTARWAVLLVKLSNEVRDDITTTYNHLLEDFVGQRRITRSRHMSRSGVCHFIVDHASKNHNSWPDGQKLRFLAMWVKMRRMPDTRFQTRDEKPRCLSELVAAVDEVERPPDDESTGRCMVCGLNGPVRPVTGSNGVFSDAFSSSSHLDDGDGICWRCEYMSNAMDYRRYHWVATTDEVRVIKERPELLDVLLDPPKGPWMAQYKDGSDFLTVLNGWITAQTLNRSRDRYRLLVDKQLIDIERATFAEMVDFGQQLRSREDAPAKRVLLGDINAADLSRYDINRTEANRIQNDLAGREDWRIAVQLIQ